MSLLRDHKIVRILLIVLSQFAYFAALIINALAGPGKGTQVNVYQLQICNYSYIQLISRWLLRSISAQHWEYIRQISDRDHSCWMDFFDMGCHLLLALPDERIYPDLALQRVLQTTHTTLISTLCLFTLFESHLLQFDSLRLNYWRSGCTQVQQSCALSSFSHGSST